MGLPENLLPPVPSSYKVRSALLGKRYSYPQRTVTLPLTCLQRTGVNRIITRIKDGSLLLVWHPCICRTRRFIKIAEFDRYGIPLNTMICEECGLMQSNPWLEKESAREFYETEYGPIYFGISTPTYERFFDEISHGSRIISFLTDQGFQPGSDVFEIGCGGGGILKAFVERGHRIAGCDYNAGQVKFGRNQGLDLLVGGCNVLETKGRASFMILSHVLEHFNEIAEELSNIRALLREDGYLFVEVPGIEKLSPFYQGDLLRYLQNAHNWHFSVSTLDRIMAASGFRKVFGTVDIMAVYRYGEIIPLRPVPGEAKRILRLCRQHELTRHLRYK
jgi:SAM-dependent methyltransferase